MLLSVIIPTYNRSGMLAEAIDSLCKQDLSNDQFEVVIVDNNSTDETPTMVEKIQQDHKDFQIRYFLEQRQGDFFARNRGAEEAVGKYLVFTDDDALFDTNYLSSILSLFETYPLVGAVGTRITIQWEGGEPAYWIEPYEYLLGALSYSGKGYIVSTQGIYLNNGSLAIKRDLYISVGGNNPGQIGDQLIGDAEAGLCRKLHQRDIPIAFTDDVTMYHRQLVGKNDTVKDIQRRVENNGVASAYTAVFVHKSPSYKKTNRLKLTYWFYRLTMRHRKALRAFMQLREVEKYNEYIQRFQTDKSLIEQIRNTNYVFKNTKDGLF